MTATGSFNVKRLFKYSIGVNICSNSFLCDKRFLYAHALFSNFQTLPMISRFHIKKPVSFIYIMFLTQFRLITVTFTKS